MDSEGTFTVSLELARKKMVAFQAQEPARYLLHIVAALVASGGTSVAIVRKATSLEVSSPGAYVPEKEVLGGFEGLFSGSTTERALDLIVGLHGAFACQAEEVHLNVTCPSRHSYKWQLTKTAESQTRLDKNGDTGVSLTISFKRPPITARFRNLFRRGSGYGGMTPECRFVDQHADLAPVPITINAQAVNRPFHLPEAIVAAIVGQPNVVTNAKKTLNLSEQTWQGALALTDGPLRVVVSGLCYSLPPLQGLSGVLYYQHLKLDISRLEVAQDETYQWLMTSVGEVKQRMFREALKAWTLHRPSERTRLLDKLAELTAKCAISLTQTKEVLQSFESQPASKDNLELCYLWARECEFNLADRQLQTVSDAGFQLSRRILTDFGFQREIVEKLIYFGSHIQAAEAGLEWMIFLFVKSYELNLVDTELWYKRISQLLPKRVRGHQKRELRSALTYLHLSYYNSTGQKRMADHLFRVWRLEKERTGEAVLPFLNSDPKGRSERLLLDFAKQNPDISALH